MIQNVILGDCLIEMQKFPDKYFDAIITDPPFGQTFCEWDKIVDFSKLWAEYNRITKETSPIIIFSSQPFTSLLITSNLQDFKYELVWIKHQATNPMFAKKGILKIHENICIFYKKSPTYNPQFEYDKSYSKFNSRIGKKIGEIYGDINSEHRDNPTGERYPVSLLYFPNPNKNKFHPTEKPILLLEYLIKTYTNEKNLILDGFSGQVQH